MVAFSECDFKMDLILDTALETINDFNTISKVAEFHSAFGVVDPTAPDLSDEQKSQLRINLLQEELDELKAALVAKSEVGVLDALTDLQYVLDGAYLSLGFASMKIKAFNEVHRSNMSKLGADGKPIKRPEDGKVLKGPNYTPPDLEQFLNDRL